MYFRTDDLSKIDVLNTPAGRTAGQVLKWVVPQIVNCWDDERIDVDRTLNRIINGVFHHPALRSIGDDGAADCRSLMFNTVEQWWREQSDRERNDLRDKLSREGVERKSHLIHLRYLGIELMCLS